VWLPSLSTAALLSRGCVNEDKGDAAGLAAAVDPRVIGALLHEHIAG
jgi:hypothetical protein